MVLGSRSIDWDGAIAGFESRERLFAGMLYTGYLEKMSLLPTCTSQVLLPATHHVERSGALTSVQANEVWVVVQGQPAEGFWRVGGGLPWLPWHLFVSL